MAGSDRIEPVLDEEILYRRIPASTGWYQPNKESPLDPEAFRPNHDDATGISLSREKYTPIEDAARGQPEKEYYVAVLRAGNSHAPGWRLSRGQWRATQATPKYQVCGTIIESQSRQLSGDSSLPTNYVCGSKAFFVPRRPNRRGVQHGYRSAWRESIRSRHPGE